MSSALHRTLTTRSLVVYYLTSVVGAGILVVPGVAAQIAGPASLIGWVLLACVAYPFALVFARMSSEYPDSSGVAHLVGRAAGPQFGDTTAVVLLVINVVGNPVLGLAAARYLLAAVGIESNLAVLWLGFVLMALAVGINALGLRIGAPLQTALTAVLIFGIVVVIALAVPHMEMSPLRPFAPYGWSAVGVALVASFFSFMGWENVSHVADEVIDSAKSFVRAARAAALMVALLYTLLALAVITVPMRISAGRDLAIISSLLEVIAGPAVAQIGGLLGFVLLFLAAIAWVLGASRLTYAAARRGLIDSRIAHVSPRSGVPYRALILLLVGYAVNVTTLTILDRDERLLILMTSTTVLLVYLAGFASALGVFRDRSTRIAAGVALCASMAFLAMGGRNTLLVFLAVGFAYAYVFARRRASLRGDRVSRTKDIRKVP